jgi:uncharacterized protein
MITVEQIIAILKLAPHPEGGFFSETFRSHEKIPSAALPGRYTGDRNHGTAIYYLLTPGTCSAMHRVASDEIFHFYMGDPVEMLQLSPGEAGSITIIGTDLIHGMSPQVVVPHGTWQGSRLVPGGEFALLGATVAPGFDFRDFELGDREELVSRYPDFGKLITALT